LYSFQRILLRGSKHPKNSAGFCGGGQGLDWAVEPRKEERKDINEYGMGILMGRDRLGDVLVTLNGKARLKWILKKK
jgi:hypothetical protein